jgi:hypothetical protein
VFLIISHDAALGRSAGFCSRDERDRGYARRKRPRGAPRRATCLGRQESPQNDRVLRPTPWIIVASLGSTSIIENAQQGCFSALRTTFLRADSFAHRLQG